MFGAAYGRAAVPRSKPTPGSAEAVRSTSRDSFGAAGHASRRGVGAYALLFLLGALVVPPDAQAALTRVYINGRPTTVRFSDGDSFRILEGEHAQRNTRLAGFNTLESFGPAHQWGDWHPYELYVVAKQATYNAARGVWHCTTDNSADGYGRLLLDCPDLAVDQIRKGYAHTMEVDDVPSRPAYIRAQQEAMRERRGMWAHGVVDFVLTSLHSRDEDPTRPTHYNRLVSTRDGHSEAWEHRDRYAECSWQCATIARADATRVREAARRLRSDPEVAPALVELTNPLLIEIVDRYARLGELPEYTPEPVRAALLPKLSAAKQAGQLGDTEQVRGACMLYADFRRRYGQNRASCLHGHGTLPPGVELEGGH